MVVRAILSSHRRLPRPFGVPCRDPLLVGLYLHETAPLSPTLAPDALPDS